MKDNTIQSCLRLCQSLFKKGYGPAVNVVVCQYLLFFQEHQALVDTLSLDPLNKEGSFWKVRDQMIKKFLARNKVLEEIGYIPPILIKNDTPQKVFEALDILSQGFKSSMEGWKVYYYSISLSVPLDKLKFWANPILYFVVDTKAEAGELFNRVRKPKPSEVVKERFPISSENERMTIDRERKKQSYNPYVSDSSGDILGEDSGEIRGLGNRR